VLDATTDLAQLHAWHAKWPASNWGIALGPSRLVDVAPDDPVWLSTFAAKGLPPTLAYRSGGGDGHVHYLYRRPDACPETRLCRSAAFDIMSSGLAVLPGSLHASGRRYDWLTPPEDFPR
jgi:hypothetical protein